MAKKHQLNMPWIHFHVREALYELRELEALLEYLETGKKPKGMFRTDVDRFCKEGKPDESAIEIHLAASLAHAYHHMNFGWNSRRCVDTRRATDAFSKNENFPQPSEAGWTFDRFWSKRCLKCLAKRKRAWPQQRLLRRRPRFMLMSRPAPTPLIKQMCFKLIC